MVITAFQVWLTASCYDVFKDSLSLCVTPLVCGFFSIVNLRLFYRGVISGKNLFFFALKRAEIVNKITYLILDKTTNISYL